jgi:signal transduction histidine kinase
MQHCESKERGFRKHRVRRFIGARLHRRIFLVMGVAILVAFSSAALLMHSLSDSPQMEQRQDGVKNFAARRFAEVWGTPRARDALAREVTEAFGVALILKDSSNVELLSTGGGCKKAWVRLRIPSDSNQAQLGSVSVCSGPFSGAPPSRLLWALFVVAMVLWIAAGILARRLGRPLWKLARVTTQIGEGDLSARVRLGRHEEGEVGVLSESINRMAVRIEKQMNDQRHLLAEVSHEIRTPLARLRIITELLRDESADARLVADAEREIAEIDELVGQLLASSRLEFVALERRPLDGAELCREALKRLSLASDLLKQDCRDARFEGDPTLIARALSNLLRNAEDHGGHVTALTLRDEEGLLYFEVSDDGPGFSEGDDERIFDPFVQGRQVESARTGTTLGL